MPKHKKCMASTGAISVRCRSPRKSHRQDFSMTPRLSDGCLHLPPCASTTSRHCWKSSMVRGGGVTSAPSFTMKASFLPFPSFLQCFLLRLTPFNRHNGQLKKKKSYYVFHILHVLYVPYITVLYHAIRTIRYAHASLNTRCRLPK